MTTHSNAPETLHAWSIFLQASEEARRRGDRRVGTDHIVLALCADPSMEDLLDVTVHQAREALDSLDREALAALGLDTGPDAPPLSMRAVPKSPKLRDIARTDRLRMSPAAKKVLENAAKHNRRRTRVTAPQVLAQILTLRQPDPAAVLLGALHVNVSEVRARLDTMTTEN